MFAIERHIGSSFTRPIRVDIKHKLTSENDMKNKNILLRWTFKKAFFRKLKPNLAVVCGVNMKNIIIHQLTVAIFITTVLLLGLLESLAL